MTTETAEARARIKTLAQSMENAGGSRLMSVYDPASIAADLRLLLASTPPAPDGGWNAAIEAAVGALWSITNSGGFVRVQAAETKLRSLSAIPDAAPESSPKRTMTIDLTEREQEALQRLMDEQELSPPQVFRQALKHYQLDHERRKAGETVTWSGDAQRARDFAGPLASAPTAERLRSALERIEYLSTNHGGWFEQAPFPEYAKLGDIARAALSDAGEGSGEGSGVADAASVAGSGGFVVEVPIDQETADAVQKAADFLDAAAGEGIEIEGGGDAMDIVSALHGLLVEDSERCFHEDVALWLRGKIRPMLPEVAAPASDGLRAVSRDEIEQEAWKWWMTGRKPGDDGPFAGFHAGYRAALDQPQSGEGGE